LVNCFGTQSRLFPFLPYFYNPVLHPDCVLLNLAMQSDGKNSESDPFELYARVLAALSTPGVELESVLSGFGMTLEDWDALEERCDATLCSEEITEDEILGHLGKLAQGLQPKTSASHAPSIDFETWLRITRSCQRGTPILPLLAQSQVTLEEYLTAQTYWLQRLAKDPELQLRYQSLT
jgi:hypothetical protein